MKFSRPKDAGTRLKQNYIKLREAKLSQYNVTLPKGIVFYRIGRDNNA